jgi:hypothetical protein
MRKNIARSIIVNSRTNVWGSLALLLALLISLPKLADAQPVVSYITPDAGAAGMTVAVEFIGPASSSGNFGSVGFYAPNTKVQLQNASDSTKLLLGPATVSWDGKMVQVMVFVQLNATNGNVPLVVVNGSASSPVNFQIVTPQTFGTKIGGGSLAGGLGTRTARGTMVVDSMILTNGTYTVSTTDLDNGTNGNQAFLPLRILSKGPIRIVNATLDVHGKDATSGAGGVGGPGGGGGGGGSLSSGGDGYTGGGGVGQTGGTTRKGGAGTGSDPGATYYNGGTSLSGVPGGYGTEYNNPGANNDEGGGAGTGHPFGLSGDHGLYGSNSSGGGYGGGTGGGQGAGFPTYSTYAGGGGGYATSGSQGGGNGDNSGHVNGNAVLIPLAGGSGGASANVWYSGGHYAGNGGGGGGAVELSTFMSFVFPQGSIDAHGGHGSDGDNSFPGNGSGGGAGSGGAVVISARDSIAIGSNSQAPLLNIAGGTAGNGYNRGGDGGSGRIRLDGRVSNQTGDNLTVNYFSTSKDYIGPVVTSVGATKSTFTITGYGKGWLASGDVFNSLSVYYRFPSTGWQLVTATTGVAANSRTAKWTTAALPRSILPGDSVVYIAAMQADANAPGSTAFTREPNFVMTHTSGMIAKLPGIPRIAVYDTIIDFGKIRVGKCSRDTTFKVFSVGTALLRVDTARLSGSGAIHFTLSTLDSLRIIQGDSNSEHLAFCPKDTGCFTALLTLNSNDTIKNVLVSGCGIQPQIQSIASIDFGAVKVGACKDTTFTITNTGNDTLHVTSQLFGDAHFKLISPNLPYALAPAAKLTVTLEYCATDSNSRSSADTIHSDARDSTKLVLLNARGKIGVLSMLSTIDFGLVDVGSCKDTAVVLKNTGNDTLYLVKPPTFSAEFVVPAGQFPMSIAPDSSRVLLLRYCPTDTLPKTSSDSVRTVQPANGKLLTLMGRGIQGILTTPNALDLGCVVIGFNVDRWVTLKNVGTAAVTSVSATVLGSSQITILQAPRTTIPKGSTDSLLIHFAASVLGRVNAKVVVTSGSGSSVQIPITAYVSVPPVLLVLDTLIDFDTVTVGDSARRCIRVMNPSCAALSLKNISIAGTSGVFHVSSPSGIQTLSDSAITSLCFTFVPTKNVHDEAAVTFLVDSNTTVIGLHLIGQGAAPVIEVRPPSLDFGDVLVTTTSPAQNVYVINRGIASANVLAPSIVGPNAAEFAFSGLSRTLLRNDSIAYAITMTPATVGTKRAYFVIPAAGALDSVLLTGRGVQPGILVTRQRIDFAKVDVNPAPVPTQTFVVRNTGSAPLTVNSIVPSGDASFTLQQVPAGPVTLSASTDSILVTVSFAPTSTGIKTGTIAVNNTTSDQPTVDLAGEGVQAVLSVSVDTIDFGNVFVFGSKDSIQVITISNIGYGKPLTISNITLAGPNNSEFQILIPASSALQPGDVRSYDAIFSPMLAGLRTADLTIQSDTKSNSSKNIHLLGNGIQNGVPVIVYSDTVTAKPGDMISMPLKIDKDLSPSGVTQMKVRVMFNSMLMNLSSASIGSLLPTGSTVTKTQFGLGDQELSITSPKPIAGPGTIAMLNFEVLADTAPMTPVTITQASFGASPATLSVANPGLVIVQACRATPGNPLVASQNHPNPFNPISVVDIDMIKDGYVTLTVFNEMGQSVLVPFSGAMTKGSHAVTIDATHLPSGTYRYVVEWRGPGYPVREIKAMTVVK